VYEDSELLGSFMHWRRTRRDENRGFRMLDTRKCNIYGILQGGNDLEISFSRLLDLW